MAVYRKFHMEKIMEKHIKILMVDDEARFRETTRKLLTKKGFEVHLAGNGKEALHQLSTDPDVVILDIRMPGMDGHEVLQKINEKAPDLPVIMLTGHGGRDSAKEALTKGAFDYLTKPCDIDILARKIEEAYRLKDNTLKRTEAPVSHAMVPIAVYTAVGEDQTLEAAIHALQQSFESKLSTESIMETGHRSILVVDGKDSIKGILTIRDMLEAILPGYLSAPKPFMADSIEYSPMFWSGMFTLGIREKRKGRISDIMSPTPLTIDGSASLMEAAYIMVSKNQRRLLVVENGKNVGIVREQDLFFEMVKLIM